MKKMFATTIWLVMVSLGAPILRAADWAEVSDTAVRDGLPAEHVTPILQKAREAGYTADQTAQVLKPALEACRQGLPARPILDKIEEGLVKRIQPETLAQAGERRYRYLDQAASLAKSADQPSDDVIYSATLALESGMGEQTVQKVLNESRGKRPGQAQTVIEAGEAMMLNGMDEASVSTLMSDCLQRNLRRSEVLRTVRYSCQQHQAGMQGSAIRQSLWGQGQCDGTGNPVQLHDGSGSGQQQGGGGSQGQGQQSLGTGADATQPMGPDRGRQGAGGRGSSRP